MEQINISEEDDIHFPHITRYQGSVSACLTATTPSELPPQVLLDRKLAAIRILEEKGDITIDDYDLCLHAETGEVLAHTSGLALEMEAGSKLSVVFYKNTCIVKPGEFVISPHHKYCQLVVVHIGQALYLLHNQPDHPFRVEQLIRHTRYNTGQNPSEIYLFCREMSDMRSIIRYLKKESDIDMSLVNPFLVPCEHMFRGWIYLSPTNRFFYCITTSDPANCPIEVKRYIR